jgi:aspartate aminotransferase
MLENLQALAPDPILGLMADFRCDTHSQKVDLGVGIYKDADGNTPVLASVKAAEARLLEQQSSKAYIGPAGNPEFNHLLQLQLLGAQHPVLVAGRAATVQMPGGCGALRAGAELIMRARPGATIWVSDPTWANHMPLLGSAGLKIATYPYYCGDTKAVRFDAMMETLEGASPADVVLLHGCCHNPCGADLNHEQWAELAELLQRKGLLPFVDVAYQGFGEGLEADVAGLRLLARQLPEMLIASSCSKNFGLYRDRTGALTVIGSSRALADIAQSQVCNVVRALWSMPPDHGAAVVATILASKTSRSQWLLELAQMRDRINALRVQLVDGLAAAGAGDFGFIGRERGMFSFLGLSPAQVTQLRQQFSIYMVDSSRINIAGISPANSDYVCAAIASVSR